MMRKLDFVHFDTNLWKLKVNLKIKYIDSGIKLDKNKYNQKLSHIYFMTKWTTNNYFLPSTLS